MCGILCIKMYTQVEEKCVKNASKGLKVVTMS
jgi:hypothetical protein